jgi:hypothetical protein
VFQNICCVFVSSIKPSHTRNGLKYPSCMLPQNLMQSELSSGVGANMIWDLSSVKWVLKLFTHVKYI